MAIAADTSGGVFVLAAGYAGDVVDLVLHHVTASGAAAPAFPDSGVIVRRRAGQSTDYALVSDDAGGVFVSWWDNSHGAGNADIFAQCFTGSGAVSPGWPAGGVVVCGASGDQANPVMVADGAGGAVIVWHDLGPYDLCAQRLTATGQRAPGWTADGVAVCTAPGIQALHVVAADGAGGVYVAWMGYRNLASTELDIYAASVTPAGQVRTGAAGAISLLPPRPNPASSDIRIDLDVTGWNATQVWLDIVDLAGRRVRQVHSGRPGPGRLTRWWNGHDDDGRAVHPGLYFVCAHVTQDMGGTARQSQRIVVVR